MYEVHQFKTATVIHKTDEKLWIPMDEANTDYQAFLAWVAEGNEPEVVEL